MRENTTFDWNPDQGLATAIIEYKDRIYVGTAQCHPDDKDFQNMLTGQEIAYRRASIKVLCDIKKNELKPGLQALKDYLYSINKGKYFNKKDPMVKILYHNINIRQEEIDMIDEMIKNQRQDLREYLASKEKLYSQFREKRAKAGKTE